MKLRTATNIQHREKKSMRNLEITKETYKEMARAVGLDALMLFITYRSLAPYKDANLEDDFLADLTGKSEVTIRKLRLKLTKAGYFLRERDRRVGKGIIYHVGKEAVNSLKTAIKAGNVPTVVNIASKTNPAVKAKPIKFGRKREK